jgi:hypothetical protein
MTSTSLGLINLDERAFVGGHCSIEWPEQRDDDSGEIPTNGPSQKFNERHWLAYYPGYPFARASVGWSGLDADRHGGKPARSRRTVAGCCGSISFCHLPYLALTSGLLTARFFGLKGLGILFRRAE